MSHEPEEGKTPEHPQESSPRESEYIEFGGQNINGTPEQPAYTQPGAYSQPISPYPPQGAYPPPIPPYLPQGAYPQPMYPYPPQGAYPPPMYPYPPQRAGDNSFPEPPPTPLTLKEGLRQLPGQWWKVVRKPSTRSFVEEKGKASWSVIWVLLILYGVIGGGALVLQPYIPGSYLNIYFQFLSFNQHVSQSAGGYPYSFNPADFLRTAFQVEGLFGIIFFPLGYLLGEAIYLLIAKLFKGSGSYRQQAYANMLYIVPTTLVISILSLVPFLGGVLELILGMIIGVYFYVLRIFATQAVHRLSIGRALAVVFIPVGLAVVLSFLLSIIIIVIIIMTISTHPYATP
jgi:hypothetical protein